MRIKLPTAEELFPKTKEPTLADLRELEENPLWMAVLHILQRKAYLKSNALPQDDSELTKKLRKAEGVNDALGDIDSLFKTVRAQGDD